MKAKSKTNEMETIGEIMQRKRAERAEASDARYEASLTAEDRRKREEYAARIRQPATANIDTVNMAWSMFQQITGKSKDEAGKGTEDLFGRVHNFLERDVEHGFLMVGGTGCGKTTMAKTFARVGRYRVVSCIHVVHEYEADRRNIEAFRSGSICFDDLGAEGKAYGNEVMADILQSRYDLWRNQIIRMRRYRELLDSGIKELERNGIDSEGLTDEQWNELLKKDKQKADTIGNLCSYVNTLRVDIAEIRQDISRTHITSNIDYKGIAERYGERVASRLHEMCRVVSFGNEPDHRIENK